MEGKIKVKYKLLWGKNMPYTRFGISGCSYGLFYDNWETYHYGIEGLFGLRITKEWVYNLK